MGSMENDSNVSVENNAITNPLTEKITRRQAISRLAWTGIGVVVAAVAVGGGYYAYEQATAPSGPSSIKLGAVLSLTGPMAGFGEGLLFGHQQAIADLNAQGGIQVGGKKLPITYKYYDDGSDPTKAGSLASQLILSDKVDLIVHGNGPPVTTIPIGTTAERYGVPCIVGSPFEPWSAAGPYKYTWSILFRIGTQPAGFPTTGYTITSAYFGLNDSVFGQTDGNASVLACGDSDGTGWYGVFPDAMKTHSPGYNVISPLLYPVGTTDFSSIIATWKSAKVDILWANTPGPDFGTFWRQAAELNFRPKIALVGRAPLFYTDINAWGDDLPLAVCTECWWDPSWPFTGIGSTTPEVLASRWTSQTGSPPLNRNIAFGYSAIQIVNDAVGRAGTLDKDKVNTAIGGTNMNAMTGPIKFFPDTHDSPCPVTIKQWQKGTGSEPNWVDPIVFSQIAALKAPGTFEFPLPPWP